MLPLSEFKKHGYKRVRYPKADNGNEMRTIVLANRKEDDANWYDEKNKSLGVNLVPEHIIEEVKSEFYSRPFNRSLMDDNSRRERARREVFAAVVVGTIESAPTIYKEDEKTIVFEDFLVCQPIDVNFAGLRIYVPHRKAGLSQTTDLRFMIDRIVPLKIVDLKERRYDNFKMVDGIKNNYVAIGDIDLAELLMNSEAIDISRFESQKGDSSSYRQRMQDLKTSLLEGVQNGIITHVAKSGVYVLDENLRSYKIPRRRFSYGAYSRVHDLEYYAEIGAEVHFKHLGWKTGTDSTLLTAEAQSFSPLDFTSGQYLLWGSSIELETSPTDKLKKLVDKGELIGSTHIAYLLTYDVVRGHFIELEGFPGVRVKLRNNKRLDKSLVYTHEPISVVVRRARYRVNEEGQTIFSIHCDFNTAMKNAGRTELVAFFKR